MTAPPHRGPAARAADALASPVLNAVLGISGIAIPIAAWASERSGIKNNLLIAETLLVVLLTVNHLWQRNTSITLRRATNLKAMDDAEYYELVRAQLERELVSDYGEIADGHMQVYAGDVPRLSALLVNTLVESPSNPKRILAADLTTDPGLLAERREYLAANRRLMEAGGTIDRLFIVRSADLAREDFARPLLELVDRHRRIGVTCGLAVRERLRAEQAVDFVVIASAAALIEEEQGDIEYLKGRSSVWFKGVERWTARFESAWGHGSRNAPSALRDYEATARPMAESGTWDTVRAGQAVALL